MGHPAHVPGPGTLEKSTARDLPLFVFSYSQEIPKISLSTGFSDTEGKEGRVDWFGKRGGSSNGDRVVPLPAKVLILLSPEKPGTSLSSPHSLRGSTRGTRPRCVEQKEGRL